MYVIEIHIFFSLLAHLSMLRVSFWDCVMSVLGVDVQDVHPSTFCLCIYTVEGTVWINLHETFRTLIFKKFRSSSKLGHVGSKTRSLGQILGKPCVQSSGHSSEPKFMKLFQNVNCYKS